MYSKLLYCNSPTAARACPSARPDNMTHHFLSLSLRHLSWNTHTPPTAHPTQANAYQYQHPSFLAVQHTYTLAPPKFPYALNLTNPNIHIHCSHTSPSQSKMSNKQRTRITQIINHLYHITSHFISPPTPSRRSRSPPRTSSSWPPLLSLLARHLSVSKTPHRPCPVITVASITVTNSKKPHTYTHTYPCTKRKKKRYTPRFFPLKPPQPQSVIFPTRLSN
ncbi:hypothetical protein GGI42DRAFT_46220 [Trichoderma sp. SZMC 28013]